MVRKDWAVRRVIIRALLFLSVLGLGEGPSRAFGAEALGKPESGDRLGREREILPARRLELLERARAHRESGDPFSAGQVAEELLGDETIPPKARVEALLMVVRAYSLYGQASAWQKVRAACESVLGEAEGLGWEERWEAACQAVEAYRALWAHAEQEVGLHGLLALPGHAVRDRVRLELDLARVLQGGRRPVEALEVLDGAEVRLNMVLEGMGWRPGVGDLRAEAGLLRGLCLEDLGRLQEARLELDAVGKISGPSESSRVFREARLRRVQRGWEVPGRRVLKVLFVGSSHTLMGDVPWLVERISASAGPLFPLIVSGEQARSGTGMRLHWTAGDGAETARRRIKEGVWDVVVVEAFYRSLRVDLFDYGSRYRDLVRSVGARLVIYGTPAAKALEYPGGFEEVHENHVWLGRALGCEVAPGVRTLVRLLGERPERGALDGLYKDWIHSTAEGAYLSACALYSALSGASAEGLFAPGDRFSEEEARRFQRAAWVAYGETRDRVGGVEGSKNPKALPE